MFSNTFLKKLAGDGGELTDDRTTSIYKDVHCKYVLSLRLRSKKLRLALFWRPQRPNNAHIQQSHVRLDELSAILSLFWSNLTTVESTHVHTHENLMSISKRALSRRQSTSSVELHVDHTYRTTYARLLRLADEQFPEKSRSLVYVPMRVHARSVAKQLSKSKVR